MNNVIQLEDRVSCSRSKHEGESSAEVCDRLSRTRVSSQRQLPTDHDYAVPTREYQLDQSSRLPATTADDVVIEVQQQKQPQRFADSRNCSFPEDGTEFVCGISLFCITTGIKIVA